MGGVVAVALIIVIFVVFIFQRAEGPSRIHFHNISGSAARRLRHPPSSRRKIAKMCHPNTPTSFQLPPRTYQHWLSGRSQFTAATNVAFHTLYLAHLQILTPYLCIKAILHYNMPAHEVKLSSPYVEKPCNACSLTIVRQRTHQTLHPHFTVNMDAQPAPSEQLKTRRQEIKMMLTETYSSHH